MYLLSKKTYQIRWMIQYVRKIAINIFHKKPACEDNFLLKQIHSLMLIDLSAQINFTFYKTEILSFLQSILLFFNTSLYPQAI